MDDCQTVLIKKCASPYCNCPKPLLDCTHQLRNHFCEHHFGPLETRHKTIAKNIAMFAPAGSKTKVNRDHLISQTFPKGAFQGAFFVPPFQETHTHFESMDEWKGDRPFYDGSAGSIPAVLKFFMQHHNNMRQQNNKPQGCRQAGLRHQILILAFVGSNPTTPANPHFC